MHRLVESLDLVWNQTYLRLFFKNQEPGVLKCEELGSGV
jgi:hypothetical protein